MPTGFAVPSATLLHPALVPEFFVTRTLEDAVFLYLHSCRRAHGITGLSLDDFIIEQLKLSDKVRNYGRLTGMEYLIDLLQYHFYNNENGWYVTCKEPYPITFLGQVSGWDRLFIDISVTKDDCCRVFMPDK